MREETSILEKVVLQHNAITSGRYEYNATQLDIMFMLIAQLGKNDLPDKIYKIYVKDIESLTGKQWNHQQFKLATEGLGSRTFSIQLENRYRQMWMFQHVDYIDGAAHIEVRLSESMRPYLFDLKNNYTRYKLKAALACTSKHSKRLYQFACQWRSVGIATMRISELKEMLYLKDPKGIEKEEYTDISTFKKRVLDVAKREINQSTDINFDYKLIKEGRAYTKIKIFVNFQEMSQTLIDFNEPIDYQLNVKAIMAYGINEQTAKIIAKKNFKDFENVVSEVKEGIRTKRINLDKDLPSYIIGTLQKKGILKTKI
ncbi:replication initiation protein [Dyadobacter psychrotolerans]|uniref:RepB family plasmid replication initiator protein n=1 Tax=Dyadobacter psychrotolerans TaxID=2541721 RepID=A0A4V2Z2N6_9BACT|nr:replication initiation protein [Dyadobacter psychrotolerans]TDE08668.1 RepB family plasmid replication initiator protein [Dyadobacter psychrotolerans]